MKSTRVLALIILSLVKKELALPIVWLVIIPTQGKAYPVAAELQRRSLAIFFWEIIKLAER